MYQRTTAINPGFRGGADEAPMVDTRPLSHQERVEKFGRYLLQTVKVARPTGDEPEFRHIRDDWQRREAVDLARQQWDNAERYRVDLAAGVAARKAEREATAQAEREARDAARLEARQAERAAIEEQIKTAYMRQPGALQSDWERDRERVISDYLISQAGRADEDARQASFRRLRQAW